MTKDSKALGNAIAAVSFLSVIAGAVVFATLYLLELGGVHLLVALGWLPASWESGHQATLVSAALTLAAPLTAGAAIWMFRRALAGERALERDGAAAEDGSG